MQSSFSKVRAGSVQSRAFCRPLHTPRHRTQIVRAASKDVFELKQQLQALAGSHYGHDKTAAERQQIEALAASLSQQQDPNAEPAALELKGSRWRLLYTNSTGNSSGKIGPFIASSEQVVPTSRQDTTCPVITFCVCAIELSDDTQIVQPCEPGVQLLLAQQHSLAVDPVCQRAA